MHSMEYYIETSAVFQWTAWKETNTCSHPKQDNVPNEQYKQREKKIIIIINIIAQIHLRIHLHFGFIRVYSNRFWFWEVMHKYREKLSLNMWQFRSDVMWILKKYSTQTIHSDINGTHCIHFENLEHFARTILDYSIKKTCPISLSAVEHTYVVFRLASSWNEWRNESQFQSVKYWNIASFFRNQISYGTRQIHRWKSQLAHTTRREKIDRRKHGFFVMILIVSKLIVFLHQIMYQNHHLRMKCHLMYWI